MAHQLACSPSPDTRAKSLSDESGLQMLHNSRPLMHLWLDKMLASEENFEAEFVTTRQLQPFSATFIGVETGLVSRNAAWRDDRVADCAALEMLCPGNRTGGSNPPLSA